MTTTAQRGTAPADRPADLRSFGRRRGRRPTAHQRQLAGDLLPRVSIGPEQVSAAATPRGVAALCGLGTTDAEDGQVGDGQFGNRTAEVWLEIGFGGGEHLIWQARQHPRVGIIGSEPFEDGVIKVLSAIQAGGLDHVRLLADDVRPLLRALPDACLSRVFILFPDPWPKRRHQKRRLIQPVLVGLLARVMRPGAQLRIATDIGDYARTILLSLCGNPDFIWNAARPLDWRSRSEDWPSTRYEAKAAREGRRSYYFRFERR